MLDWFFAPKKAAKTTYSSAIMDRVSRVVAETIGTDEVTANGILVAGVIGLVTVLLVVFLLLRRRSARGNTVVMVGLSDAGKTLMFRQLITENDPNPPETYTSMQENVFGEYTPGTGGNRALVRLVDYPGADKLRKRLFSHYLSLSNTLKAIVFVVDSASFPKLCKDVAELVYEVLIETPTRVPVLVACNKQDLPLAKSSQVIRVGLEKEFNLLNRTRAAALGSTDSGGGEGVRLLAPPDKEFRLENLRRRVEFVECTARVGKTLGRAEGLTGVEEWIAGV